MASMINGSRGFLSAVQIADRWSCHANTVRRLLKDAESVRVGRLVRYPLEEVERIERNGWNGVEPATSSAPRSRRSPSEEGIPGINRLRDRYGAW